MSTLGTRRLTLHAGHRLDGRYELLCRYAQGGMATVWLARVQGKHGFEKLYAVKTLLPHLAADEAFRTMFLDEARIASRIRHGNVAEIEDLGEDGGHLYMVIEWIQGDAWSKLCAAIREQGDPIPADLMLHIAAVSCAGLHAAHELTDDFGRLINVVHRDVSPQNIMLTEAGAVKVIDFGIAKAIGRASEHTRAGLIKGKLEYLAPEQALGGEVDRRADVWAVGATLYHIFSGHPPFTGKNDLDVLRRISTRKPPSPLPPTVPKRVADVIMHSLQPDLAARVPSALDLGRMLESVMASHVSPEDLAGVLRRYLKRRMQARHQSIADALRDAAARAALSGGPRSPSQADLPPMRASLPTLPPEAAPLRSQSGVLLPADAPERDESRESLAPPGASTPPPEAAPRLRPIHAAWLALATLVTVGVWSAVVALALQARSDAADPGPDEHAAPALR
jgi:serine/threonine-protein kinase